MAELTEEDVRRIVRQEVRNAVADAASAIVSAAAKATMQQMERPRLMGGGR